MPVTVKSSEKYTKIDNLISVLNYNSKLIHEEISELSGNKGDILNLTNQLSGIVDDFIILTANYFKDKAGSGVALPTIIATGGYGRAELAPYSDIDLLFLSKEPLTTAGKKYVKEINNALWQAKLKVGYSVQTLDECLDTMSKDIGFLTSLLERRFLRGDKSLYKQLDKEISAYKSRTDIGKFISEKLAERDARHKKMGDTRYSLEPNVKESKGALRDIQTLLWLSQVLYGVSTPENLCKKGILVKQEAEALRNALLFFWEIRCRLHLMAGRADDRLTFDAQPALALQMGYRDTEPHVRAEKFMKKYFRMATETAHLTRILCANFESRALATGGTAGTKKLSLADNVQGFPVVYNRLSAGSAALFRNDPSKIVGIFRASQISGLDIHPDALRQIKSCLKLLAGNKPATLTFFDILIDKKNAEKTLRHMNEAGVISALLPEFDNIHAHMQYDMYHVFTADEHTIRAIGIMHAIERGDMAEQAPLATGLFSKIQSRRILYAAMFLHDIAKGTGGKHSEKGAAIARRICPLFGLEQHETETVAWLVEQHLLMTMTAFKRDLGDTQTLYDFVAAVQSPERLKLLTILTTADIMAVGPDRWNNWKSGLIEQLYRKTSALMSGSVAEDENGAIISAQKQVRRLIGIRSDAFLHLVDKAPKHLWSSFTPDDLARYIDLIENNETIALTPIIAQGVCEMFVYLPDRKGLFALLSGAIAASGASIVAASIFTLSDGMALDVFQIQGNDGQMYDNRKYLEKTLRAALSGQIDLDAEIASRKQTLPKKNRLFKVEPRVIIDNNASAHHTMIEVNGKDRPGFLYDITNTLSQCGLQIMAAKVTTFGSRAVDSFYVKDLYGLKVLHAEKLATIEKNLKLALEKTL